MDELNLQSGMRRGLPQGGLSEDERLEDEMRTLRLQFPSKEFRIVGKSGKKRVEVVLGW